MGCELGNLCWFYWLEIRLVGNWRKWKIHSVQFTLRANSVWASHEQWEINKDEPYNSLLAPREEQSTPSITPCPDGTHKKTDEGEDPTSDEENGNAERPFFSPSLNPDGVFAKFLVKQKADINAHDQQALRGETCAHDTLGIDTNQLVLEDSTSKSSTTKFAQQ